LNEGRYDLDVDPIMYAKTTTLPPVKGFQSMIGNTITSRRFVAGVSRFYINTKESNE
jgi:hypothetical protein